MEYNIREFPWIRGNGGPRMFKGQGGKKEGQQSTESCDKSFHRASL